MKSDGELLGSIAPYVSSRDQASLTYTVPLPQAAFAAGVVRLRLQVQEPGAIARAATPKEVEGLELIYVPTSR